MMHNDGNEVFMLEDQATEFKKEYTEDLKKEAIAFLNTNSGTIYIGINDDGHVCGVNDVDKTMQQISSSLRNSINPDCTMFFKMFICHEGDACYIRLDITQGTKPPYYLKDKGLRPSGVYVRVGNTTVQASEEMIRTLLKSYDHSFFEDLISHQQNLTFKEAQNAFETRDVAFKRPQMKTLGLIDPQGKFTNLALLLSDQCPYSIKCAIFEGKDMTIFKDRKEFCGSVFKQIDETLAYLNVYNKTSSLIGEKLRSDFRDYPTDSVREAIMNAVVHRDYSFSGSIMVRLFDDRLEILSLGGLLDGLTLDDISSGISQQRNKKLASVFFRLHYIETYGTGIPRILASYQKFVESPTFTATGSAFKITMPNMVYKHSLIVSSLSHSEKAIYNYLKTHASIDKEQAASLLNLHPSRAYTILRTMANKGCLITFKEGKKNMFKNSLLLALEH